MSFNTNEGLKLGWNKQNMEEIVRECKVEPNCDRYIVTMKFLTKDGERDEIKKKCISLREYQNFLRVHGKAYCNTYNDGFICRKVEEDIKGNKEKREQTQDRVAKYFTEKYNSDK